ncbi:MAG: hypothetical protein ACLQBD_26255 [Syntrophobacteraceae bacterium]
MIYLILFLQEYDYHFNRSAIPSHVSLFGSQVPPTWLSLFGESAAQGPQRTFYGFGPSCPVNYSHCGNRVFHLPYFVAIVI